VTNKFYNNKFNNGERTIKKLTKAALITLVALGFFMAFHAAEARKERVSSLNEAYTALGQQHFGGVQVPCNPGIF